MKLNEYKQLFSMSYTQFVTKNNIASSAIHVDLRYEKLRDVTRVDLPDGLFLFFRDDQLQMIYISEESLAKTLWNEFKSVSHNSAPEKTVRSRAGKTSNQLIFAAHGIAASINKDDIDFMEIYRPCSLEYYLENIYREPGLFIR